MPRPAPKLHSVASARRSKQTVSAVHGHRGRVAERRAVRGVKAAPARKLMRVSARLPKGRVRGRVRRGELRRVAVEERRTAGKAPAVMKAPAAAPPSMPVTGLAAVPAETDGDDSTSAVRDLYLAHEPASTQVPVVSLVRPTAERPQLPEPQDVAAVPAILPSLYDQRGRLVMPAALRGSHEILVHQNEMADRDGLSRVQDDEDLEEMRRRAMLVSLPVSSGLQVDERLPGNRRYCRPWTANFLAVMARAHYARFHTAIQINSAVRTVAIQQRLLRTNGNAAPASGETASPHLTGQAVDIAKRGLSLSEIAWVRGYLLPFIEAGKIDVEEEFQQSCFHISVYRKYGGAMPESIAVTHRDRPAALAIMLR